MLLVVRVLLLVWLLGLRWGKEVSVLAVCLTRPGDKGTDEGGVWTAKGGLGQVGIAWRQSPSLSLFYNLHST